MFDQLTARAVARQSREISTSWMNFSRRRKNGRLPEPADACEEETEDYLVCDVLGAVR